MKKNRCATICSSAKFIFQQIHILIAKALKASLQSRRIHLAGWGAMCRISYINKQGQWSAGYREQPNSRTKSHAIANCDGVHYSRMYLLCDQTRYLCRPILVSWWQYERNICTFWRPSRLEYLAMIGDEICSFNNRNGKPHTILFLYFCYGFYGLSKFYVHCRYSSPPYPRMQWRRRTGPCYT